MAALARAGQSVRRRRWSRAGSPSHSRIGGRSKRQDCLLHFTDLHYKGDRAYAQRVVDTINGAAPDFACFTGDLVEDRKWFEEALSFIEQIKVPVYGSPGNHDYHSHSPFAEYQRVFSATGGRWLADDAIVLPRYDLELVGMGTDGVAALKAPQANTRFLLSHYPKSVEDLVRYQPHYFDWIMAGHSHGGQVRIPGYGSLIVPWAWGITIFAYFETKAGPLYVNPGVGGTGFRFV